MSWAFFDLIDPGVTAPNRLAAFHSIAAAMVLGHLGTEDDLITLRPDTIENGRARLLQSMMIRVRGP